MSGISAGEWQNLLSSLDWSYRWPQQIPHHVRFIPCMSFSLRRTVFHIFPLLFLCLIFPSVFFETWFLQCKRTYLTQPFQSCTNSVREEMEGPWPGSFMRNAEQYEIGCLPYYSSGLYGQWDWRNLVRISFPVLQGLKISLGCSFAFHRKQQKPAVKTKYHDVMVRPRLRTTVQSDECCTKTSM